MTSRLQLLDVLRAMAALLVVAVHFEGLLAFAPPDGWPEASDLHFYLGLMGVELFFVISGMVILLTIERSSSIGHFAIGRLARLYPAYWASVGLAGGYLIAVGDTGIASVAVNTTMLQKFIGVSGLIPSYWTLAYELWFYAVMATISATGLIDRIDRLAIIWLLIASALRLRGIDFFGSRMAILFMPQFGHLFIAGMMIYRITSGRATTETVLALGLCFAYSLFGRTDWAHIPPVPYFVVNAFFIVAVWAAARDRFSFLARPWLVGLGACSYSLYLFHVPIGMMLVRAADSLGQPKWLGIALAIPISIFAAIAARRYIEIPGQHFIKSMLKARDGAASINSAFSRGVGFVERRGVDLGVEVVGAKANQPDGQPHPGLTPSACPTSALRQKRP
jgi:peptidoglycan/LPS O-acetylase OafA/YrhL